MGKDNLTFRCLQRRHWCLLHKDMYVGTAWGLGAGEGPAQQVPGDVPFPAWSQMP